MTTAKQRRDAESALTEVRAYRRKFGGNQKTFWSRFCVTQSGGSRYEARREIPRPLQLLMALVAMGMVSEQQLAEARGVVEKVARSG